MVQAKEINTNFALIKRFGVQYCTVLHPTTILLTRLFQVIAKSQNKDNNKYYHHNEAFLTSLLYYDITRGLSATLSGCK